MKMLPPEELRVIVSKHAKRRFKQRVGLPGRATITSARKALVDGLPHTALHPHPRARLERMMRRHQRTEGSFMRLHDGYAYIFAPLLSSDRAPDDPVTGVILVTVLGWDVDKQTVLGGI